MKMVNNYLSISDEKTRGGQTIIFFLQFTDILGILNMFIEVSEVNLHSVDIK